MGHGVCCACNILITMCPSAKCNTPHFAFTTQQVVYHLLSFCSRGPSPNTSSQKSPFTFICPAFWNELSILRVNTCLIFAMDRTSPLPLFGKKFTASVSEVYMYLYGFIMPFWPQIVSNGGISPFVIALLTGSYRLLMSFIIFTIFWLRLYPIKAFFAIPKPCSALMLPFRP
jgi:hypothetical protein